MISFIAQLRARCQELGGVLGPTGKCVVVGGGMPSDGSNSNDDIRSQVRLRLLCPCIVCQYKGLGSMPWYFSFFYLVKGIVQRILRGSKINSNDK